MPKYRAPLFVLTCMSIVFAATCRYSFVDIVSAQRSGSTNLQRVLTKHPCLVPANEIFQNNTQQSGDAWATAGAIFSGGVKALTPNQIIRFIRRLHAKKCQQHVSVNHACRTHCALVFKHFHEHLTIPQHTAVLRLPDALPVVLERNVSDRWRSSALAFSSNDWDTEGREVHKARLKTVPEHSVANEKKYCNLFGNKMCLFSETHNRWFAFARQTARRPYVSATFNDYIQDAGDALAQRVFNRVFYLQRH
jgi:hypothetical protein